MAAKNASKALSVIVPFASVIWFKDMNQARRTGKYGSEQELKKLYDILFDMDWALNDNGIIRAERIPPELIDRAVKERGETWASLQHQAKLDSEKSVDLLLFEELYCEKSKLIVPEYLGISGNRRSTIIFQAKTARKKKNLPVGNELPIIIYKPSSPLERLRLQCDENEFKMAGFLEMSNEDRLMAAREVLQFGGKEADLASMFKRGMSQKLWGIVRLDAKFPDLKIVDRMCLPLADPQYIPWGLDKELLRALVKRSDTESLTAYNQERMAKGDAEASLATKEEVERYLGAPHSNGSNKPKILDRDTIAAVGQNFPNETVRLAMQAVIARNVDLLKPAQLVYRGQNAVMSIAQNGDYPPLEDLLIRILDAGRNRSVLLEKLIAACQQS